MSNSVWNLQMLSRVVLRILENTDCDIRDYGKKVHGYEIEFDETNDKLQKATETLEEKDKMFKEVEGDISALTRRWFKNYWDIKKRKSLNNIIMLMEEESKKSEETLATTVTKRALSSKVCTFPWLLCDRIYFFMNIPQFYEIFTIYKITNFIDT